MSTHNLFDLFASYQDDPCDYLAVTTVIHNIAQKISQYHKKFPLVENINLSSSHAAVLLSNGDEIHITNKLKEIKGMSYTSQIIFKLYDNKPGKLGSLNYHLKDSVDFVANVGYGPPQDRESIQDAVAGILLESFARNW